MAHSFGEVTGRIKISPENTQLPRITTKCFVEINKLLRIYLGNITYK